MKKTIVGMSSEELVETSEQDTPLDPMMDECDGCSDRYYKSVLKEYYSTLLCPNCHKIMSKEE